VPQHTEDVERGQCHSVQRSLAALGVVFGDIGTSPLYALRECFVGAHAVEPIRANVLGVLSLVFWALVLVISVKYVAFILRADNRGEGGILALLALLNRKGRGIVVLLGVFGAALLYGDGMITPAISVLSAVEGIGVATPVLARYVVPVTIAILVGLFWFQRRGTGSVGAVFGPVTLLWFLAIAALGVTGIAREPSVIAAVDPRYAFDFFAVNRGRAFLVLGAVVLVVTGGEALYADLGHFGAGPIRRSWFAVVFPALTLNYFGQGALVLANPAAAHDPFYRLAPGWALYPLIVLATAATVIASQAVITGAFSLSRQAVQLDFSPRLVIKHTSSEEIGQIYVPQVNWALMLATIGLVLGFRSSSNLAAAYGVAVTGTMGITTLLFFFVVRERWAWSPLAAGLLVLPFLSIDLAFFAATLVKVAQGGWFPLVVAAAVFTVMTTWKRGRELLAARRAEAGEPLDRFLERLPTTPHTRVEGTAAFMTEDAGHAPPALLHNLKHNKVVHAHVLVLIVRTEEIPRVSRAERLELNPLGPGFHRLLARYGFMETPNVPRLLVRARERGLDCPLDELTFFVGHETLLPTAQPGMAVWRKQLFAYLFRNQERALAFYQIPAAQVIELGAEIEL
jgi:KUP system potassium uptake protein